MVLLFLVLGGLLLLLNSTTSRFLDGNRSYIAGESYWSTAQKSASIALIRYIEAGDDDPYTDFLAHLDVVESARISRNELLSANPVYYVVRNYYLQAGHRDHDTAGLIWIYENFKTFPQAKSSVNRWIEGEMYTDQMRRVASLAYNLKQSVNFDDDLRHQLMLRTFALDDRISVNQAQLKWELKAAADETSLLVYRVNMVVVLILLIGVAIFLILQVRAVRKVKRKAKQSENKFRDVLNYSRDVIYRLDVNTGKYQYVSPSVMKITGYEIEEIRDGGIDFVLDITHPEDRKQMESQVVDYDAADAVEKLSQDSEFRIRTKQGKYIWVNNKRALVLDKTGKVTAVIGNVRDISDRKEYVEALDASLKEKEILLAEIHHRVKNNLSIVSSIVELQKGNFDDVESRIDASLSEIQSRIKSIALVHEKLYQTETFSEVDLSDYLADLVDMIHTTFDSDKRDIIMRKEMDSLIVNIKKAVPIGLICNELINNCYKYAFDDGQAGEIKISLGVNSESAELKVSDNGKGLPDDFDEESNSLGMTLIKVFTQQIGGDLNFDSAEGTIVTVKFDI